MNKKEKIILFGASRGGENFIKHNMIFWLLLIMMKKDGEVY